MANEVNVDEMVKRTYRYFYDDGLAELAVGLLFTLLGLVLFGWNSLGSTQWVTLAVVAATVLLVLTAPFLVTRAVRAVKARLTYPRTGYVAYRPGEPSVARWLLMAAAVTLIVIAWVVPELNQMSFAVGVFLALILGLMGYRVGLRRFYLVAIAAEMTGTLAAALDVGEVIGTAVTFAVTGLLLLLSGGVTLLLYLRQHPRPDEDASHG